jgi:hypothetical protein
MFQSIFCLFGLHGVTEIGVDAKKECHDGFKEIE